MLDDTIAAISTPLGEGGIGIIRLSGPAAVAITKKIFRARKGEWADTAGGSLIYGHVYDHDGNVVDEVLLGYMKAPRTYTREDVIEINCHGGAVPLRRTLELALAAGARLAKPGEFSLRAFLNGRLDLAQAESVIDVIRAKTAEGLKLAVSQLKGDLSQKIIVLQKKLLGLLAQVEANIDFPEEGLEEAAAADISRLSGELQGELGALIRGAETGKIYRDGISTIIIGRPNVGKSSLLNALLKENRAIVTDIPGTTRDIIEEIINIGGVPLKIIDTAGLHDTENIIEKMGIEKTKETIEKAGLVLLVLDATKELTGEDLAIIDLVKGRPAVFLINKSEVEGIKIDEKKVALHASGRPLLWISAIEGTGLEQLEKIIFEMVTGGRVANSAPILVTNTRHKRALEKASEHLEDALEGMKRNVPVDIAAIDIRAAWEALGEITGSTVTEDLLDRIFADFCIGK